LNQQEAEVFENFSSVCLGVLGKNVADNWIQRVDTLIESFYKLEERRMPHKCI